MGGKLKGAFLRKFLKGMPEYRHVSNELDAPLITHGQRGCPPVAFSPDAKFNQC